MKQKLYRLQRRAGFSPAKTAAGDRHEGSELRCEQTFCHTSLGVRDRSQSRLGSRRLRLTRRRPIMFKTYLLSCRWRFRQYQAHAEEIHLFIALGLVAVAIIAHLIGLVP